MIPVDQLLPKGRLVTVTGVILDSDKFADFIMEMNLPDDKSPLQAKNAFEVRSYGFNDAHRDRKELALIIRTLLTEHANRQGLSDELIAALNLVNDVTTLNVQVIESESAKITDDIFTSALTTILESRMGETITPELISEITGSPYVR